MLRKSTYTWDMVQALESTSPTSCKAPATVIDSICPKTINQEKKKNPEMRSNFQQIISTCLALHTQNPGLREVDLEPSPKRCSDKINMQKKVRNTHKKANHIVQLGIKYGCHHLERYTWKQVQREEPVGPELY